MVSHRGNLREMTEESAPGPLRQPRLSRAKNRISKPGRKTVSNSLSNSMSPEYYHVFKDEYKVVKPNQPFVNTEWDFAVVPTKYRLL